MRGGMSLLFFDGENFSTLIIAALGADAMGQTGLAAIGAGVLGADQFVSVVVHDGLGAVLA